MQTPFPDPVPSKQRKKTSGFSPSKTALFPGIFPVFAVFSQYLLKIIAEALVKFNSFFFTCRSNFFTFRQGFRRRKHRVFPWIIRTFPKHLSCKIAGFPYCPKKTLTFFSVFSVPAAVRSSPAIASKNLCVFPAAGHRLPADRPRKNTTNNMRKYYFYISYLGGFFQQKNRKQLYFRCFLVFFAGFCKSALPLGRWFFPLRPIRLMRPGGDLKSKNLFLNITQFLKCSHIVVQCELVNAA